MKVKHAIITLVAGFLLMFVAGWLKISHKPHGDEVLLAALIVQMVGAVMLLFKLLSNQRLRNWLNS